MSGAGGHSSPTIAGSRSGGRWDDSDRTATASVGASPHPVASAFLMVGNGGQFVDNGCLDPDSTGSCCTRLHRRGLRFILFALVFCSGLAVQSAFGTTLMWLLPSQLSLRVVIEWTFAVLLLVATAIVASYMYEPELQRLSGAGTAEDEDEEDLEAPPARPPRKRKIGGSTSEPPVAPQRSRKRGEIRGRETTTPRRA